MSKIATKLGIYSAGDMYQLFVKDLLIENPTYTAKRWKHIANGIVLNGDKEVITYTKYKDILSRYNKKAADKVIHGYTLDLYNRLGNLFVARVERPAGNKRIDHASSKKLKKRLEEEGTLTETNWLVYYNDDDFIMAVWHKGNRQLTGIRLYNFKAAYGQVGKGFRRILSKTYQNNPYLKALYPFLPCKTLEFIENKPDPNGILVH